MKLLLFILLCLPIYSFSQETAMYYYLEQGESGDPESYDHLKKAGYRLAITDDSVRLYLGNPYQFARAIYKNGGNLLLVHKHGQSAFGSRQLRNEFRAAYLESFHWRSKKFMRSRKRYFNRLWRGKERKLNTKRAVYIALPVTDQHVLDWHIQFRKRKNVIGELFFQEDLVRRIDHTPYVRENNCQDGNRWTRFSQGNPAKSRLPANIPEYSPERVTSSRKIFSLTFASNAVEPGPGELEAIRRFLKSNQLPVDRIYIHGFASVEGDSLRNQALMEDRAQVITNAIRSLSDRSIPIRVRHREHWQLFERQIRREGWPQHSRSEWKELLENDSVRRAMEPWLARQRSARLMIYLEDSVSDRDLQQDILREFQQLHMAYTRRQGTDRLRQLLSIRRFIRQQVILGEWPNSMLTELSAGLSDYDLYVLFEEEQATEPLPPEYLVPLLENAWEWAIRKCRENPRSSLASADLLYVQQQLFQAAEAYPGIHPEQFTLPEGEQFLQVQLNYMAYREEHSGLVRLTSAEAGQRRSWRINPSAAESRYYHLLKNVAKETLSRGLKAVAYRSDWMREFDLAEFLDMSLRGWDPFTDTYLDPEFDRKKLGKLMHELQFSRKHLCPDDVTYLRLTYSLKLIQAGSVRYIRDPLMHQSIKYVLKYYLEHGDRLTPTERMDLANQLAAANSYLYFNEAKWLAEELRRLRTGERLKGTMLF